MKFLIAGLGSIGRRHLRNLLALGEQDILLYRTNKSTLTEDELGSFPVYTSLQKALAQKPDAVLVCNPTSLHLDVAIPAAHAGCHLFLEKPISHSFAGIDSLQTIVKIAGVQVLVGYQFRFHPGLNFIRKLLSDERIGKPVSVRAHWGEYLPDWHPWEDYRKGYAARIDLGGGVIRTLCHPFDYLRWLFGEVESVRAIASNQGGLGLDVEDSAEIGIQFANGVIGSVHLDYVQRPPEHCLQIVGSEGTIRWNNADGSVHWYQAGNRNEWQVMPVPDGFERNQMFLAQLKHFLAVLKNEQAPVCTLDDGIQALRIVEASYRSASAGKVIEVQSLTA